MEIWNNIDGFEGLYKISSTGKVISLGKGKSTCPLVKVQHEIKQRVKRNGYVQVKLNKEGKRFHLSLHRLVAKTFLLNKYNKPEINHKDGNKLNNSIANLEWVTASENQKHAYRIGTQKAIKGVLNKQSKGVKQLSKQGEIIKTFGSITEVKRELGFNSFGISKCCKKEKRYKTAYGFKWEYV